MATRNSTSHNTQGASDKIALSDKPFLDRLLEALQYQKITDPKRQAEKVAQACKVTIRTARKYLHSTTCPLRGVRAVVELSKALDVNPAWLAYGAGYGPYAVCVAKAMETMTEWEKNKYLRFVTRLHNNDAKASRLSDMLIAGQISRHQFLAAM